MNTQELIPTQSTIVNQTDIDEAQLPELNYRQQLMLNYILAGDTAAQAYIKAGYDCVEIAHNAASQLVRRPPLKTHIDYYRQQLNKAITKEWKAEKLKQIVEHAMNNERIAGYDSDSAIKAIQELNKMSGDYAPQQHNIQSVHATIDDLRQAKLEYKKDE